MIVFLAKTTTVGIYPTAANACYNVTIQSITGNETEGAAATYAAASGGIAKAYNVGPNVPPSGTTVICRQEISTNRFVFFY